MNLSKLFKTSVLYLLTFIVFFSCTSKVFSETLIVDPIDDIFKNGTSQSPFIIFYPDLVNINEPDPAISSSDEAFCYNFSFNLKVGDKGNDVIALGKALSREGILPKIYVHSNVFTTELFLTVSTFQNKYATEILYPIGLTKGTGYIGPATRAKLNKLYGCIKTIAPTPIKTISIPSPSVSPIPTIFSSPAPIPSSIIPSPTPTVAPVPVSSVTPAPIQTPGPVTPPDLTITTLSLSNFSPTPGSTVTLQGYVKNIGGMVATNLFNNALYYRSGLNGNWIYWKDLQSIENLLPNKEQPLLSTWTIGNVDNIDYYFKVMIDSSHSISESNESNNEMIVGPLKVKSQQTGSLWDAFWNYFGW